MRKLHLNRIYLGTMVSYIIVLFIPTVLLGILITSQVRNVLEEETRNSAMSALSQARQTIDTRIKELDEMTYQISSNRSLRVLLSEGEFSTPEKYFTIADFTRDFGSIASVNKFIGEAFVYIKKENAFLTPVSIYSTDLIYSRYGPSHLTHDQWMEAIADTHHGQLWPAADIGNDTEKRTRALTYSRSIPINSGQGQATVLALIYEETIRSLFETHSDDLKGEYYIVDENNDIIFTTDPGDKSLSFQLLRDYPMDGLEYYSHGGQDYIAVGVSSHVRGWHYYSIIQHDVFMSKVNFIGRISFTISAACLLLGLVLAFYLSRKNFMPIKRLIASISKAGKPQLEHLIMDYPTIIGTIEETFDKKSKLEDQIKQQVHNIRSNFMKKLLMNKYMDPGELERMQDVLNIHWMSEWFNVIIIHIDDYSNFSEKQDSYRLNLVRLIIINIAEELLNRRHQAFSYEEEGRITLLVNYNVADDAEIYTETAESLKEIIQFIGDRFKIELSAGVGNACKSLQGISVAWAEAEIALNQRIIDGKKTITLYREIVAGSSSYYYPMDIEIQIMNHVRMGDYEGAERLLDIVYDENYVKRRLPIYLVNCLFFDMAGTILKVLDSAEASHEEVFGEGTALAVSLLPCETVAEMHHEIKSILRQMCNYINEKRESNNNGLKDRVMAYIEQQYADKNLSLLSVADHFGMSSSYLSRFFKDHSGYNFIDFLTRLRIAKAKTLLKESTLSITEIADKIGYGSSNSFIRSFKKYESVTPGQFKDGSSAG